MLLIRFFRFLIGYVVVSVIGDYPERFLNLCVNSGFRVWNTKRRGENMEFCLAVRDYKRVRLFRRKCGVKLRIKRRSGLPFLLARYRRLGLVAGAVVFVAVLAIMPRYVWSINISGNSAVNQEQLSAALDTVGISVGTPLSAVDADNMRLRLALLLPQISWASINIDGTCVNVEVREATPRIESDDAYSNLTAMYDGIVTAVYVRSGTAAVKVGDAVAKGDLLVSGTEEYKNGATYFRHSDADIIAETERTAILRIPIKKRVYHDVSEGESYTVLNLLGRDIPLYIGGVDYPYRAEYTEQALKIGGVTLPVGFKSATFYKLGYTDVMLTESDALLQAESALNESYFELFGDFEVLSCDMSAVRTEEDYIVTAKYCLKGDITKVEYFEVEMQ